MATVDLNVSSVISATGWTGATVGNLSASNNTRATDGTAGEVMLFELDNAPGDFDSLNSVTLKIEGRAQGTVSRAKKFLVELLDSSNTLLESFTTATIPSQATDVDEISTARARSEDQAGVNAYRLRVTAQENGGMADSATVEVDWPRITIDYNVAPAETPVSQNFATVTEWLAELSRDVIAPIEWLIAPAADKNAEAKAWTYYAWADGSSRSYPPDVIGASLDLATVVNTCPGNSLAAPGSDLWCVTWADDGHQYTSWGDGGGFGGTNTEGRVSWGVARLEGAVDAFSGINVNGGFDPENVNDLPATGKAKGILSIDGDLYMWRHFFTDSLTELYKSTDHGATWDAVSGVLWDDTDTPVPGFESLSFIQYGQDYAGVPDHAKNGATPYVYSVGYEDEDGTLDVQIPGGICLLRVPVTSIEVVGSYEWFAGFDVDGVTPLWTDDYSLRVDAIESANGFSRPSCVYNPIAGRYVLIALQNSNVTATGAFISMWQAEFPWGPWTRFLHEDVTDPSWCTNAGGGNPAAFSTGVTTWQWSIAQKWSWQTPAGNDFVLMGALPGTDEFGIIKGTLQLGALP